MYKLTNPKPVPGQVQESAIPTPNSKLPSPIPHLPSPISSRGLTLVEVLVSFFLFTIVMLGTSMMIGRAMTARTSARHIIDATNLADTILNSIKNAAYAMEGNLQREFNIFPAANDYTAGQCPFADDDIISKQTRKDNPLFMHTGNPTEPKAFSYDGTELDDTNDDDGDTYPDKRINGMTYNWSWGHRWCSNRPVAYIDGIGREIENCFSNPSLPWADTSIHDLTDPDQASPPFIKICITVHWTEQGGERGIEYAVDVLRDKLGPAPH